MILDTTTPAQTKQNLETLPQRDLLLDAIGQISRVKKITTGLKILAKMMVEASHSTLCIILKQDPDRPELAVCAAHAVLRQSHLKWDPHPGKRFHLFEDTAFTHLLQGRTSLILRRGESKADAILDAIGQETHLEVPLHSVLIVQLRSDTQPIGLCLIGEMRSGKERDPFKKNVVHLTQSLAAQTSILFEKIDLNERIQNQLLQLRILHKITDYIEQAQDLNKILKVVLTGITAGYGLGYNRAALFLFDHRHHALVGQLGIGFLNKQNAEKDWQEHNRVGMENFEQFLIALEQNTLKPTPVEKTIFGLRIPFAPNQTDLFTRAILAKEPLTIPPDQLCDLPENFIKAFRPAAPLIAAPLISRGRVLGLLVADNKFTGKAIGPVAIQSLYTFLNSAAIAVDNQANFQYVSDAQERIRQAFEASNTLVSDKPAHEVVQEILEGMEKTAGAAWVSLFLVDPEYGPYDIYSTRASRTRDFLKKIRKNGNSMLVMRTGVELAIEDTADPGHNLNRITTEEGVKSVICLPMAVHGQPIGVLWIDYYVPQEFDNSKIDALKLLASQAAIAYDNARRMETLRTMQVAARELSLVDTVSQVLNVIADQAQKVFNAHSSAVWSYDDRKGWFIPDSSAGTGLPEEVWKHLKEEALVRGGTSDKILQDGWIKVEDLEDRDKFPYLGYRSNAHLAKAGVKSFQASALRAGEETLGILFVNYDHERNFGETDRQNAATFSNLAALALKKARLHEQVTKSQNAAKVVARVSALGDKQETLKSIVNGILETAGCDAVTLYIYNPETNILDHPPALAGVIHPSRAQADNQVNLGSIVYLMMRSETPVVVENTADDPRFTGRRFTIDEGIVSVVAVPLKAVQQTVGVVFVNFRQRRRFTQDELDNMMLFSNQAAVAIHNMQLHEKTNRQIEALKGLYEAGKTIISTLTLDETLRHITEQALSIVGEASTLGPSFSHIALCDGQKLKFVAASRPEILRSLQTKVGEIDLKDGPKIGVVGRTVKTGRSQNISDMQADPDIIHSSPDVKSQLSVLLKIGTETVGVLSIESDKEAAFSPSDEQNLELLAAQAAVAIQNARQYDELKRTKGLVGAREALAWMGMASSTWMHSINGNAVNIRGLIRLIQKEIGEICPDPQNAERLERRLLKINEQAEKILNKRVTPPLSSEDGVLPILINDLVKERMAQLRDSDEYALIETNFIPEEPNLQVRVSPEWFRRAFDIMVENAVNAMANVPVRRLTLRTRRAGEMVEILVSDTGKGIAPEYRELIFNSPLPKPKGSKGMGMGLIMAKVILQTYKGDIRLQDSSSAGSTFILSLPTE